MIRQLCPHCNAVAELPETAAGTNTDCPKCGKPISVPAGYTPTVAPADSPSPTQPPLPPPEPTPPAAPPPGYVPPKSPSAAAPSAATTVALPHWLIWLPATGLTVAFLATFFPWVGSYPDGVPVYTQTPWQAAFGSFSTAILPDGLTDDEAGLRSAVTFSGWLVPYLPLLVVGVVLVWAERFLTDHALTELPSRLRWLAAVGPHRQTLLAGVTVLLLLLVILQTWRGYGLERAAQAAAVAKFAEQATAAQGNQNKETRVRVLTGFETNRLGVESNTLLRLALLAHLIAAGGAAGRWYLHRRGDRPVPRLVLIRS